MGPKYNVFIKKEDRFIFENVPRGTFERERKEGLYKYVPRGTLSLNMLKAEKPLKKFRNKGEKTGWTYIEIIASEANLLNPGVKKSYALKGQIDEIPLKALNILPMGDGSFILSVNGEMRKKLGKKVGDKVKLALELDFETYELDLDFTSYLETEPKAYQFFKSLTNSHQKYFSKWIESAKTDNTKAERIALSVQALSKKMSYSEMIRAKSKQKDSF